MSYFSDSHVSTLQASFLTKKLTINGVHVTLSIWDTAGQERFHALGPIYYRDSNGAVVVYDVTDPHSFDKAKTWVKQLRNMLGENTCLAIVGNKIDLLSDTSNLSNHSLITQAQKYSETITNAIHYCTSAKKNKGIDEMFLDLIKRMVSYQQKMQTSAASSTLKSSRSLRIADDPQTENVSWQDNPGVNKCNC